MLQKGTQGLWIGRIISITWFRPRSSGKFCQHGTEASGSRVKAVPSTSRHEGAWGRGGIAPTHSRHSMGWVVSVNPRPRFTPGKDSGTHCTGGWVGPRAGLDTEARGKSFRLCPGSNLDRPFVQPVARHYTDWAIRLTSGSMRGVNTLTGSELSTS
jgi:hypothetical protein